MPAEALNPLHPRARLDAVGLEGAEAEVLAALARDRFHHAWLLTGPKGIGKATLAYRIARRLLGAQPEGRGLGSAADHPVTRQVAARSHPDLMVLERASEDGKPRKTIPVDEVRRLPGFFAKSPAAAPYRVAIVDAVDDFGLGGANAVLKTLEEPPARGVLLLVSHAPGGLLSTLRSRCRTLPLRPRSDVEVAAFLEREAGLADPDLSALVAMAGGAPGQALDLFTRGALELDQQAENLFDRLPAIDRPSVQSLIDGPRGQEAEARFQVLMSRLAARAQSRALKAATLPEAERWAGAWTAVGDIALRTESLNLDRGDALHQVLGHLRNAARC